MQTRDPYPAPSADRRQAVTAKSGPFRRQKEAAFTIVEVMMAAIVLVLGIVTSLTTLQFSMRAVDTARNMTLAGQIMQSELEILRLNNWAQISALPASAVVDPGSSISSGSGTALDLMLTGIATRFTCTRTVADIAGRSNIKLITLNVSWVGVDSRTHTATYQTRYAKNGLSDYLYVSH